MELVIAFALGMITSGIAYFVVFASDITANDHRYKAGYIDGWNDAKEGRDWANGFHTLK